MKERPDGLKNLSDEQVELMLLDILRFGQQCAADPDDAIHHTDAGNLAQVVNIVTYEQGGYLSPDKGLALTMRDGSVFQLNINRSRNPEFFEDEEE